MKSILRFLTLLLFGSIIFVSCVNKEFDEPEFPFTDPNITTNITIKELKSKYKFDGFIKLEEDLVFSAIVIANDSTGNFYKKIVVQDSTGGIEVLIDGRDMFNKFPVGRRVFIKAKGLILGDYSKIIQLGYDVSSGSIVTIPYKLIDDFIIGGSLHNIVKPKIIAFNKCTDHDLSTLIQFDNVEFKKGETFKTYADGVNLKDDDRFLINCIDTTEFDIRTSGYAKFANDRVNKKNGSIVFVLGKYNDTYQGAIRNTNDIYFTKERCSGSVDDIILFKDFDDKSISSGGWKTKKVVGDVAWETNTIGGRTFCQISNYDKITKKYQLCETWLISPKIELSQLQYPSLDFLNACNYNGSNLEVYISQDYDGFSSPSVTSWRQLNPILSGGNWSWNNSGFIDLSEFKNKQIYIGFRYFGSQSNGKTWEIDEIAISNYKVEEPLFKDNFESGLSKWSAVSEKGNEVWVLDSTHGNPGACARISGFANSTSNENEDWLISSKIDLTSVSTAALYFDNTKNYTGNDLELYVSKNYSGSGSPASATWTLLNFVKSEGSWNYVSSGKIDLKAYTGSNIYIAFKYTSTTSGSATWEIDNVKVTQ